MGSSHGQGTQPQPSRSTVGAHDSQGPPCTWWLVRADASKSRRARDLQDSALCIATRSDNVCKGTRDNMWRKFSAGSWMLRLCIHQGFASQTPSGREVVLTLEEQPGLWTGDQGELELYLPEQGLLVVWGEHSPDVLFISML